MRTNDSARASQERSDLPQWAIGDLTIERRQVGTAETLLAAGQPGGARDLATDNNVHIAYTDQDGQPTLLRLEMLTGVTVGGQAKKCTEMPNMMRVLGIRTYFADLPSRVAPVSVGSIAD